MACLLLMLVPSAAAQDLDIYQFDLEVDETRFDMDAGTSLRVPITFYDYSKDSSNTIAPGTNLAAIPHLTKFDVEYEGGVQPNDFQVRKPTGTISSQGGEVFEKIMTINVGMQIQQEIFQFRLIAETQIPNGTDVVQSIDFSVITPGPPVFSVIAALTDSLSPDESATFPLRITNSAVVPRAFSIESTGNDCGLALAYERTALVAPKTTEIYDISLRAPADKFLYLSEVCQLSFEVAPHDNPGHTQNIVVNAIIDGAYVDPVWAFYILAAVVGLILLLFFLARRKAIIEEEILGKPQRPWTIPVERVYLEHLEARDARAAYVVRHFLMEEEYRSALLWYKSYKSATRGTRAKETLVVGQEKSYNRFQKKWERKVARPIKKADRVEARLQKKLDRQAKVMVRKDRRKWKKQVAKAEERHAKRSSKLLAAWEKDVKKADKRGEAAPAKPDVGQPDLPAKPELQKILLADHKWQKKADRVRRRMVKKQGNLEVRFEKKDARRLAKVRRKVQKIARKIDDPEFASEHPLLIDS